LQEPTQMVQTPKQQQRQVGMQPFHNMLEMPGGYSQSGGRRLTGVGDMFMGAHPANTAMYQAPGMQYGNQNYLKMGSCGQSGRGYLCNYHPSTPGNMSFVSKSGLI
ncbi:hypothetical protein Ciccas_013551, partial [Cichlidogyrus casuarinus]